MEDIPLEARRGMWLQQDGAPPHFWRQVTMLPQISWVGTLIVKSKV